MFLLITPPEITSRGHTESRFPFDEMEVQRPFSTLDDAIDAAIQADLDLDTAIIEKNGGRHSVKDWIACRIAGGLCGVG
jgi:hypothetical protein